MDRYFFLEHFPCPLLRPGQIIILDHAKAQGVEDVRELIESKGARLFFDRPIPLTSILRAVQFSPEHAHVLKDAVDIEGIVIGRPADVGLTLGP
jgi:hypothetical protein